jgi:hypothetical protein
LAAAAAALKVNIMKYPIGVFDPHYGDDDPRDK